MKHLFKLGAVCFSLVVLGGEASAHCEVPCGIYDDNARFTEISEHTTTIERAMKQINAGDQPVNQVSRWVMNKEKHAEKIQFIVSQYFLTQRIKPSTANYHKKLEVLHKLLLLSMKSKQGTDLGIVTQLRNTLKEFEALYKAK